MENACLKNSLLWFALLAGLAGCSPFTADIQPAEMLEMPPAYSQSGETSTGSDRWWQNFDSADLNRLVDEALADNLSLRQAWARLDQARALSRQSASNRQPDLSLNAEQATSRQRSNSVTSSSDSTSLGLTSSFEIDFWGRVAAEINSQQKEEQATREDLHTVAISLSAEVAERWLQLLTQVEKQRVLTEQLQTAQSYLVLVDLRFRKAQATALDLLQQKEAIAALKTELPALQAEEQRLRHELALLLGNNPQQPLELSRFELPKLLPLPELGLPAELLEQRPDVRAAGLRLQEADWDLTVAEADRLPALRLTASATTSGDFNELFDNWLLNLAGNLTAPLLDGGRRSAEVERRQAIIDERLAAYQETVLAAMREVEDALITEQKLLEEQAALKHQLQLAEQALNTAKNRYLKGLSDYLPVLIELQNVEQLQQTLLTQQRDLLTNRVALHRALGGDWTEQLQPHLSEVER